MSTEPKAIPVKAPDGHRWSLTACIPQRPVASLLWLPALGVSARHYLPFAQALAEHGVAVFLHEWRGHGHSSLRAGRKADWGYRELLLQDLPASEEVVARTIAGLPRIMGGHSLGGQLAACRLASSPDSACALWLVASGSPYWRAFPFRTRWWLPMAYRFLPWLAQACGALPGRMIGFGGTEAVGVIRDWAATALSGRYVVRGVDLMPASMQPLQEVRAIHFTRDWLGPESSLRYLLSLLRVDSTTVLGLDEHALQARADHFAWMRTPSAVAAALCLESQDSAPPESRAAGS